MEVKWVEDSLEYNTRRAKLLFFFFGDFVVSQSSAYRVCEKGPCHLCGTLYIYICIYIYLCVYLRVLM